MDKRIADRREQVRRQELTDQQRRQMDEAKRRLEDNRRKTQKQDKR
jgi:hypothetical protein